MTPEEKWRRLNKPTCIEDYAIGISESELRTFPEGRLVLLGLRKQKRAMRNAERFGRKMGESAAKHLMKIVESHK